MKRGILSALVVCADCLLLSSEAQSVPLGSFVENQGQWPDGARFYLRRRGTRVRVEKEGLSLFLRSGKDHDLVVRLTFEGSRVADPRGEGPEPAQFSFFKGRDPSTWRAGVPTYRTIVYRDLYDGVEVQVRKEEDQDCEWSGVLEYDILFERGADLSRVAIRCE